ncbi:MAG TPA: zinc-binding dehydrogenase, partial [Oligoflexia bacterium]|nr:zinc-binding dehydrogenase [Oligoflexia bacterium]
AMAEFVAVPEHILYHVPDELSLIDAAVVEPVSIAFHAVRRAQIQLNDSVAVIGCGIIGLFIVQAAKLAGCGKLIAVDLDPFKLAKAEEFGADQLINPKDSDVSGVILGMTKGQGVDVCLEAVGANATVNLALNSVKKGGKVVLVGNVSPEVAMPLQKVVTGELTLLGSCASAGEYQACIDMMAAGKINAGAMVSKVVPLDDGAMWFKKLHDAKEPLLKVVLEP